MLLVSFDFFWPSKKVSEVCSRIHPTEWETVVKLSRGDNRPFVGSKVTDRIITKRLIGPFLVIQVIERPLMYEPRPSCCVHWNARHLS